MCSRTRCLVRLGANLVAAVGKDFECVLDDKCELDGLCGRGDAAHDERDKWSVWQLSSTTTLVDSAAGYLRLEVDAGAESSCRIRRRAVSLMVRPSCRVGRSRESANPKWPQGDEENGGPNFWVEW